MHRSIGLCREFWIIAWSCVRTSCCDQGWSWIEDVFYSAEDEDKAYEN